MSRAPLILDVVSLGMLPILLLLAYSVYSVKYEKNYKKHGKWQVFLSTLLAVILVAFELAIRLFGWREQARASAYFDTLVFPVLYVHICIAASCFGFWLTTLIYALKHFANPPKPNKHSNTHKKLGMTTAALLLLTSLSGWLFYILAFWL